MSLAVVLLLSGFEFEALAQQPTRDFTIDAMRSERRQDKVIRGKDGASPFGVHDMAGNVWEWVSSLYKPYPYAATDGREDLTGSGRRVYRGGSWSSDPWILRSAGRNRFGPAGRSSHLGFRCARGVE